ncbi:MAG: pseudouridine synthase [Pseudanabaena sp. ELA607]
MASIYLVFLLFLLRPTMAQRLQKIISQYGLASRREAEQWIHQGRVKVNGQVVRELGTKADPTIDQIQVNQITLKPQPPEKIYLLLNKPLGIVSTRHDPEGRPTVLDLLPPQYQHLYPVGRLDYNSSGALILTNDGDFAEYLMHPRHYITKTYVAWLKGQPTDEDLQQWADGIMLGSKRTLPAELEILAQEESATQIQIILREGRNRQIRRVAEALGYTLLSLHRTAIGSVSLGDLRRGSYCSLKKGEIEALSPKL